MWLVIFLIRNQPASLDKLQRKLDTVQRQIQEPCYINKRFLSNSISWFIFASKSLFLSCSKVKFKENSKIFLIWLSRSSRLFFKKWVNNKLKSNESFLLHIFHYILQYTNITNLTKRFEMIVTAILRKNLALSISNYNDDSCLRKTKCRSQHAHFCVLSNWCC